MGWIPAAFSLSVRPGHTVVTGQSQPSSSLWEEQLPVWSEQSPSSPDPPMTALSLGALPFHGSASTESHRVQGGQGGLAWGQL